MVEQAFEGLAVYPSPAGTMMRSLLSSDGGHDDYSRATVIARLLRHPSPDVSIAAYIALLHHVQTEGLRHASTAMDDEKVHEVASVSPSLVLDHQVLSALCAHGLLRDQVSVFICKL